MLTVFRVLNNPRLQQSFIIHRKGNGQFVVGGYSEEETDISRVGIVLPTTSKDIEQIPEGDRVTESMTFYSLSPIFITHNDGTLGTSDQIEYNGDRYRIYQDRNWNNLAGYNKAIGMRIAGD